LAAPRPLGGDPTPFSRKADFGFFIKLNMTD
jgi:hypothetical protein